MAKSKAPTSLGITRSGGTFACTWAFGEGNYGNGQGFMYSLSGGAQTSISIGAKTKAQNIVLSLGSFYPYTSSRLTSVTFWVRGNKKGKKGWSDWAGKAFYMGAPPVPSLTLTRDSEHEYTSTVSWSGPSDQANYPYVDCEAQTMFLKDTPSTDGRYVNWSGATGAWQGEYRENLAQASTESWTRWVRVRSRGCAGASAWVYAHHTYAKPNKPMNTKATATKDERGYEVLVEWTHSITAARPCETVEVQYLMGTPAEGLTCPVGASWTTVRRISGYNGTNKVSFHVDDLLDKDQCLFARVIAIHDTDTEYGDPVIADYGELKDADNLTIVERNDEEFRATISAENKSDVEDSRLVLLYMPASNAEGYIVAVSSVGTGVKTFSNIQFPDWSQEETVAFGVYAVVGTPVNVSVTDTEKYRIDPYTGKQLVRSTNVLSRGGSIPKTPKNVSVSSAGNGIAELSWEWSWSQATSAEISWANHSDAWNSTDEPETYEVSGTYASWWHIAGLEAGQWYFRVRFIRTEDESKVYSAYSETKQLDLASAPAVPILQLSTGVTTDEFTCYWDYTSTDGSPQAYAEICEATIDSNGVTYGDVIASVTTANQVSLSAKELGWVIGSTHYLCVALVSLSGKRSEQWSEPRTIAIATPPTCTLTNPFTVETIDIVETDDDDTETVSMQYTCNSLTAMPLTVEVTGADSTNTLSVYIVRAEHFDMARPDETKYDGQEGEIIFNTSVSGVSSITIDNESLIGSLDEDGRYTLVAEVRNQYDQVARDSIDFEVHWAHKAVMPEATCSMYKGVPKIELIQPEGYEEGDTCDIYRLSADKPVLIYKGAQFGETYTDPYPAIGELGGHRIVYRTATGSYMAADKTLAWLDLMKDEGDYLESKKSIIDFGEASVELYYNQDFSSSWEKDFKQTSYLGGSVQGDWNPAVLRSTSINVLTIPLIEQDTIDGLRRLAEYSGICHVRTIDGSSYTADVQVTENREHDTYGMLVSFELKASRVDSQELDGMTFEQWCELYDHLLTPDGYAMELPEGFILSDNE